MKKSYKLLGVFWDHKPICSFPIPTSNYNPNILDYTHIFSLFDLERYIRKINLSELLMIENEQSMKNILKQLSICQEVHILKDFVPKHKHKISNEFYNKRVLQIYTYMSNSLSNCSVYIMEQ